MRQVEIKTSDFTGYSVFVRADGTYEVSDSETLPEGFIFGFKASEGLSFARTTRGAFVLSINLPPLLLVSPGSLEFSGSKFFVSLEFDTDIEALDLSLITVVPQNGSEGTNVLTINDNYLNIDDDDWSIFSGEVTVTIPVNALQGVGGETLEEDLVIVYEFTSGS